MALSVGSKAPDFTLKTMTADGLQDVRLSDNYGKKNTVLLFFPGAFTGVCTEQMCDTTKGLGDFSQADAEVYGISADTPFVHQEWAKQNDIAFPLLSDYTHNTIRAYDVELPDLAGLGPGSQRAAFLIDKEGVIRYADQTPTPLEKPDNQALLAELKKL